MVRPYTMDDVQVDSDKEVKPIDQLNFQALDDDIGMFIHAERWKWAIAML